jgi:hypothetical protein
MSAFLVHLIQVHGYLADTRKVLQWVAGTSQGVCLLNLTPVTWGVQVYACAAALIRVGGWGPVRDLAAPVMQCMLLELYTAPAGAVQAPKAGGKQAKKRKRSKGDQGAGDLAGISSGSALLASAHVRIPCHHGLQMWHGHIALLCVKRAI